MCVGGEWRNAVLCRRTLELRRNLACEEGNGVLGREPHRCKGPEAGKCLLSSWVVSKENGTWERERSSLGQVPKGLGIRVLFQVQWALGSGVL